MMLFQTNKITDDIYQITEPAYLEHANMFLILDDDYNWLIDAGIGMNNVKKYAEETFKKPVRMLLTHCHFDHVGGIRHFAAQDIFATQKTVENLRKEELWAINYLQAQDFNKPNEVAVWCQAFTPHIPAGEISITPTQMQMGAYNFQLISTPGHTDDSICLYDETKKILISGDTLYVGTLLADFSNSSKADLRNSLVTLQSLDVALTLPGHNQILDKEATNVAIENWLVTI